MCFVWLVGFELGPWLHVALHAYLPHHHHGALGEVIDDHDVDGEVDEHAADAAEEAAEREHGHAHRLSDAESQLAAALAHGAHSIEHHGVAVPPPAPPVLHPLPIDRRPLVAAVVVAIDPIQTPVIWVVARGPPRSFASRS
jgi:hypothetical protein